MTETTGMDNTTRDLIIEAMDYARTALRDLDAGYPVKELAEPLDDTLDRLDFALLCLGVDQEGKRQ